MDPEATAIIDLLRRDKIATAVSCMSEQSLALEAADICRHTEFASGVIRLAQRGGINAARMLMSRVRWTDEPEESDIPMALSAALFDSSFEAACRPQKGQRRHLMDLIALLLALPYADDVRRGRLIALYKKYLASSLAFQTEVCERNGMRNLREAMRLDARDEIRRCIGSTMPFSILKDIVLVAAVADAYPTIAADMLKETLKVAEWPIVSCLGFGIEVILWDTLREWFLNPAERVDFTDASRDWLKRAVCGEPDEGSEPDESFAEDS